MAAMKTMLKLFCMTVGERSVFSVDIDEIEFVSVLKDKIKEKKSNEIKCDADKLQLYQTKIPCKQREDVLQQGSYLKILMDPADPLSDYFGGSNAPQLRHIHVLVELPANAHHASAEMQHLKPSGKLDFDHTWLNEIQKQYKNMLKLFCMTVGEESVFSVDIDEIEFVSVLKDKIKEKKSNEIKCDADKLQLYQTKIPCKQREDVLQQGSYLKILMDPADPLSDYFGGSNAPQLRHIHVLVELPANAHHASAEMQHLKPSGKLDFDHTWLNEIQKQYKNMLKLFCMTVGEGSVFSIDIDEAEFVTDVKKRIKEEKSNEIKCDADKLQLYQAWKEHDWVKDDDEDLAKPDEIERKYLTEGNLMKESRKLLRILKKSVNEEERIHVFVRVPRVELPANTQTSTEMQNLKHSGKGFDRKWFEEIQKQYKGLPQNAKELSDCLKREFCCKIPITTKKRNYLLSEDPEGVIIDKMFVEDSTRKCPKLYSEVLVNYFCPYGTGETEASWIPFWSSLIQRTLQYFLKEAEFSRNTNVATLTTRERPDFCFYVQQKCVFRGEEKQGGDITIPRRELLDKLIWSYGNVPYILAYAASGKRVSLLSIHLSENTEPKKKRLKSGAEIEFPRVEGSDIGFFNLATAVGRLELFQALVNMSFLLPRIAEMCPSPGARDFGVITRYDGKQISFFSSYVIKMYPEYSAASYIKHLQEIYRKMKSASIVNVDCLVKITKDNCGVYLEPIGNKEDLSTAKELLQAIRDVLKAVVGLHAIGLMHRDIRWDNVLQNRFEPHNWFLIDFDDASSVIPAENRKVQHLSKSGHAPEMFHEGGAHDGAVDVWSIGRLILAKRSCLERGNEVDQRLLKYSKDMASSDPFKRPRACDALKFVEECLNERSNA